METVVLRGSLDQSLSKSHIDNSRRIHKLPSIYGNMILPSNAYLMGILRAPPPFLFHSYPSYSPQKPRQPPLLPLPAGHPRRSSSMCGPSCPPAINRTRDHSLTPKKPKSPVDNAKKEEKPKSPANNAKKEQKKTPKTKELLKNVSKVYPPDSSGNNNITTDSLGSLKEAENQVDMLPGFRVSSPPPSSLPLPSFSLRSKHSCNAEAAGVDAGATDNLRRLLRLQ